MAAEDAIVTDAPPPPAPPVAQPDPKAAPEVGVVKVSLDDWKKTQDRIAELDRIYAESERKRTEAEQRAFDAAAKEGDAKKLAEILSNREKADADRRTREHQEMQARFDADSKRMAGEKAALETSLRATEQRAQRFARDKALADALAGFDLVPNGAPQLAQLWRDQFTVEPSGDSFAVRSATGLPVADFVKAHLGSADYAHFIRSGTGHGGTAGSSSTAAIPSPVAPAAPAAAGEPRNMGEWAIIEGRKIAPGQQAGGFGAAGLRAIG